MDTPTPAYSITIKVSLGNRPGTLGRFATAIGDAGGNIAAIPGFEARGPVVMREIDVLAKSPDHAREIVAAVSHLGGVTVLDWWDRTFRLHEGGKIEVNALCPVGDAHDLAMAYTPGVARVCTAIEREPMLRHTHTIVGVDRLGAIHKGRSGLRDAKQWFATNTNPDQKAGFLSEVIRGADVFVGVSAPGLLNADDVRAMARDPIVFAMANPDPEIRPEEVDGLAAIMATGRSDFPNQINNVLAFPGVFRGALDASATRITERMKAAAAKAIAEVIDDEDLDRNYIIPSVFDRRVASRVAVEVAACAVAEGCVRPSPPPIPADLL